MKKLIIKGGRELSGEIHIGGAKNSIVALIPASILTSGKCVIKNVPDISDVHALIEIMNELGSKVNYHDEIMEIDNSQVKNTLIAEEYTNKLRASYYFMASLLGKYKKADISYPGGCIIGSRPIDFTLNSFEKMGVSIKETHGHYSMKAKKLEGTEIFFDVPSVGATINCMITGVLAKGTTRILNAAREPEIVNIADFLISMGAKIKGAGTGTIEVTGVESLGDGEVTVIPDRIEAGTYVIIGALLGKNLKVSGIVEEHIKSLLYKLKEAGANYKIVGNSVVLNKSKHLKAINVKTTVYPGFPTDLGQPMSTFLTQCEGESIFEETIYENRLRHIPHLVSMGAHINTFDKKAVITGATKLHGTRVKATDLRAGASMLVAGLIADRVTSISNIEHLLRGYERIVDKLNGVGASIQFTDN